MGDRFFEDAVTSRSYQDYRPNYDGLGIEQEVISFMKQKRNQSKVVDTLALDIGCGTGQLTRLLAPIFTKMIGIDCSESQIKVAIEVTEEKNIEYLVNVAEDLSFLQDGSVDFISTAAAIHYFDIKTFFAEVDRVLKPGGGLLVLSFTKETCTLKTLTSDDDVNEKCNSVMREFYDIHNQFAKPVTLEKLQYERFPAPDYPEQSIFHVTSRRQYDNIEGFVGFLQSTGMMAMYSEQRPEEGDQIENLKQRLLSVLAEISSTPETTPVVINCLFNGNLCKKPL